jgi:outer membrane protein assembly factor BamB
MYAFNAKTGAVIWQKTLGSYGIESGAAVTGNTVYVGDNNDVFYALDATTGQEKWRFTAFSNISTNPVIFNNTVIFGADDATVYALDTTTGSKVWTFRTENMILSSSPKISNGVVFIGEDNGYLYAINATNGQLKWKYSTNGVSLAHSTPAIYNGVVYIAGAYRPLSHYNYLGSLYAVNEFTGTEKWRSLDSLGFSTSPCVDNGKVYVSADDGNLYAVDATSGSILWQQMIIANSASAAVYGNTVYVGGSGTLNFYAFDKNTGEVKWRYGLGQQCCGNSTPVMEE